MLLFIDPIQDGHDRQPTEHKNEHDQTILQMLAW